MSNLRLAAVFSLIALLLALLCACAAGRAQHSTPAQSAILPLAAQPQDTAPGAAKAPRQGDGAVLVTRVATGQDGRRQVEETLCDAAGFRPEAYLCCRDGESRVQVHWKNMH